MLEISHFQSLQRFRMGSVHGTMSRLAVSRAQRYADINSIINGASHGTDWRLPMRCGSFPHNG
jgi:hypothetical protein